MTSSSACAPALGAIGIEVATIASAMVVLANGADRLYIDSSTLGSLASASISI